MKTFQILDAVGNSARAPFNLSRPVTISLPTTRSEDDGATVQAVRDAIECILEDSILGMQDGKYYAVLRQHLTLAQLLQVQQQLMQEVTAAKAARKDVLRREIAQTISESPKLFNDTWYGQQEKRSLCSVVTDRNATWRQLDRARTEAEKAQQVWDRCQHLVEYAIGEGEEIQVALRRAARDPNMTPADEVAIVRDLASKLFCPDRNPELPVYRTFRRIYDMLMDSHTPAHLLDAMRQVISPLALAS
jgi:hypothetical protein